MSKYGERLRELRAERQLSLRAVEERGGPNKDTMSLAERGVHKPHAQTLGRIAKAFGMSVSELNAELEEADAPKVLRPQSMEELLHRSGVSSRWLTLPADEFANWWRNVGREAATRRRREIFAEYQVIAAELDAIREGKSTVSPELQNELRQRSYEFITRNFGAGLEAPGREEADTEFYERQRKGERRRVEEAEMKPLGEDPRRLPDAV